MNDKKCDFNNVLKDYDSFNSADYRPHKYKKPDN